MRLTVLCEQLKPMKPGGINTQALLIDRANTAIEGSHEQRILLDVVDSLGEIKHGKRYLCTIIEVTDDNEGR